MREIRRYVLVDKHGNEGAEEYNSVIEAYHATRLFHGDKAILARIYTCQETELVWDPADEAAPKRELIAEREHARAEHLGELAAEREMVQAQTPVVNVQEEAE